MHPRLPFPCSHTICPIFVGPASGRNLHLPTLPKMVLQQPLTTPSYVYSQSFHSHMGLCTKSQQQHSSPLMNVLTQTLHKQCMPFRPSTVPSNPSTVGTSSPLLPLASSLSQSAMHATNFWQDGPSSMTLGATPHFFHWSKIPSSHPCYQ